ncbi:MAG TPA: tetratricopeptide repeat protein [Anaerolineae bacterium]|nr:tetratricopeptide repeat protein [Anaerolineae bacterium]
MDTATSLFPNWHWSYLLIIPGLLIGFSVHELGHSLTAYFFGDTTQVSRGKITPNPFRHIAYFGILLFVLFGIGFPKPLQFDPEEFKDRYLDSFLTAIAGPAANFAVSLLVFVSGGLLIWGLKLSGLLGNQPLDTIFFFTRHSDFTASMSFSDGMRNAVVWIIVFTNRVWVANFVLGAISILPLPGLDGFTALLSLMGMVKEKRIQQLAQTSPASGQELQPKSAIISPTSTTNKKESIADIHFRLGVEYHRQGKFDDAIARYRQAIRADFSYGPAYVNMGLAYKAKNQRNEAIQALKGATQYATDEKSKTQAWAELHNLNSLSDAPAKVDVSAGNSGVAPWTDIKPSPDWIAFLTGLVVLVFLFSCAIGLLLTNLLGK